MKKERAQTLQQRFGFADDDLKTPKHDQILLWLDKRAEDIAKSVLNWTGTWSPELVASKTGELERAISARVEELNKLIQRKYAARTDIENAKKELELLRSSSTLGDPPPPPDIRVRKKWEVPIKGGSGYIVGFIDMVFEMDTYSLGISHFSLSQFPAARFNPPRWGIASHPPSTLAFEAKATIPSLGELIRQLRLYEANTSPHTERAFYVVSPDAQFVDQLVEQGFGFISYPEGEIRKPNVLKKR